VRVIFLDIDGVLNWAGTEERLPPKPATGAQCVGIDPEKVKIFNQIVARCPDVKVVISSSWRAGHRGLYEDWQGLVSYLRSQGVDGDFIGATPLKMSYINRGTEIRLWLDGQETMPESFVVLDDDVEGMEPSGRATDEGTVWGLDLAAHLVKTTWWPISDEGAGLLDTHVDLATQILSRVL